MIGASGRRQSGPTHRIALAASCLLLAACGSGADSVEPPATSAPSTVLASDTATATTVMSQEATTAPAATVPAAVRPQGFDRVAARVTVADGTVCELCVWLAATADQRSRGLMSVTELGPANAMAFRYPSPHTGSFWMKNTLLPLSIAFYAPTGEFLDSFDMEPCTADPCPSYPTPARFLVALEVPQGGLDALGMVVGSTLELTDLPCD